VLVRQQRRSRSVEKANPLLDSIATITPKRLFPASSAEQYFNPDMTDLLSPLQAAKLVHRKRKAIIDWVHKYGLPATILPSGRYQIEKTKFVAWRRAKGVDYVS
jgi:hypothetical protein